MIDGLSPLIGRFLARVESSLLDDTFVRLVFSSPVPPDQTVGRAEGRLIDLRGQRAICVTTHESRRNRTENIALEAVPTWVRSLLAGRFTAALLETTRKDWQLSTPPGRPARLVSHAARRSMTPPRTHDLPRTSPLGPSSRDWLTSIGLTDAAGAPIPRRSDKYRQVLRYSELLGHLLRDAGFDDGTHLSVFDMGCGRGYLTFAAWQLLHRQLGIPCKVTGVEARPELVREANALVEALHLQGIEFVSGSIGTTELQAMDVLIALHACNTATDDALRRGVQSGARLILASPCCHQELRPHLGNSEPLGPLLAHGILAERLSEWLTDGLRALSLEAAGYRTKLIEFVATEHTPKNLLLAGVKNLQPADPAHLRAVRSQIVSIKSFFGIGTLAFDSIVPKPDDT